MSYSLSPSELSKLPTNKTKRLYRLPVRFYGYQLFVLVVLAMIFTWLSRDETLDRWITHFWYDAATQRFPLLDLLNHCLAKHIALALATAALLYRAYNVMRGAHFFSHNLWAGWWDWFSQVAAYGLVSTRFAKE
ncbi:hypothetical protein [unidentified bacterial endosymbiont]|uniref:hypothetical protein n=1 Tax=unidentified bacterial endosymbiont TaxID=2355 RepID=UPI0020A1AA7C|nr:hypothetical protein [unidentified bacterial endosymbiont]